jgi:hypothetical protein
MADSGNDFIVNSVGTRENRREVVEDNVIPNRFEGFLLVSHRTVEGGTGYCVSVLGVTDNCLLAYLRVGSSDHTKLWCVPERLYPRYCSFYLRFVCGAI